MSREVKTTMALDWENPTTHHKIHGTALSRSTKMCVSSGAAAVATLEHVHQTFHWYATLLSDACRHLSVKRAQQGGE